MNAGRTGSLPPAGPGTWEPTRLTGTSTGPHQRPHTHTATPTPCRAAVEVEQHPTSGARRRARKPLTGGDEAPTQ